MSAEPARLLDITRLLSRAGRGPLTGVDRVEAAYLETLAGRPEQLFLLARTPFGFLLWPKEVAARVPGLLGWSGALAALRPLAADRSSRIGLARMVRRNLPRGADYLNVGHSNLTAASLWQIRRAGLRIRVMIHDTIPLDFPEFSAPGATRRFARMLRAVAAHAEVILCNSRATEADVRRCCKGFVRVPPTLVAPLGVTVPAVQAPAVAAEARPYFVIVGTIEPRKNHALLLDVWDEMQRRMTPAEVPTLYVIGARGWRNAAVFWRLDACRAHGQVVQERAGLDDAAVAAILRGARALLMPSVAEGFGLPVAEAAAMGVPVVCSDLPVYREIVGDYPVYAPAGDMYSWLRIITEMAGKQATNGAGRPQEVPGWKDHFDLVLQDF